MPRPSKKFGRGSIFRIKTREDVLTDWMVGFSEEEISKQRKINVQDIKDIIEYQKAISPDEFNKLRKWRQKEFVENAWRIIRLGQEEVIKGLKKHKASPQGASNIVATMMDKIKATEGREVIEKQTLELSLSKEEEEELRKAKLRIEQSKKEVKLAN